MKITHLCFCINLNSYNTFTGNVIFDLHALPGFGIFTFFFVVDEVDEPGTYHQTSCNTRRWFYPNFRKLWIEIDFLTFCQAFQDTIFIICTVSKAPSIRITKLFILEVGTAAFFQRGASSCICCRTRTSHTVCRECHTRYEKRKICRTEIWSIKL